MKAAMLAIVALLSTAPVAAADKSRAVDPVAAIKQGKFRCGWPDPARKTCMSLARYVPRADGGYDVRVQGAPGNDGLVLTYSSRARVYRGAVCITITDADMSRSTFTKAGVPLIGKALASAREGMREWYAPLLGREVCDLDAPPDAKGVSASVSSIDGKAVAELDRPVMWISDADGFSLAQAPGDLT